VPLHNKIEGKAILIVNNFAIAGVYVPAIDASQCYGALEIAKPSLGM
jgi:hypothetical protein